SATCSTVNASAPAAVSTLSLHDALPISFTLYSSNDCSTGGVAGAPVQLDGSGDASPSQDGVQTASGISYKATYNGSSTYNTSTSDCEPLAPVKLASSLTTAIKNAAGDTVTSAAKIGRAPCRAKVWGTEVGGTSKRTGIYR